MLGEYGTWLDENEIPAESKTGWPTPAVYESQNVEAFIASMMMRQVGYQATTQPVSAPPRGTSHEGRLTP